MATSRTNYKARNSTTIKRAFANFKAREEALCEVMMRNAARDGLNKLIEAHELSVQLFGHEHSMHLDETNTLGYALAHDGTIVESGCHEGGGFRGGALGMAQDLVRGKKGWVAVILADMQFGHYHFNEIPHEEDMLYWTAEAVRDEFYGGLNSVYVIPGSIPKPK